MKISAEKFRADLTAKQGRKGKSKRGPKYGNVKTTVHGLTFDSKREADRYAELATLQRAGIISDLRLQVPITLLGADGEPLRGESGRALKYLADFIYRDESGAEVVEDTKGYKTRDYLLKKAILRAQGVTVLET